MDTGDKSDFPIFKDGDVYVVVTAGQVYQLHAVVLRRSSKTFAKLLTESRAAAPSSKAKGASKAVRFWLELDRTSFTRYGVFTLKDIKTKGRTNSVRLPDVGNGKITNDLHNHYDQLFRAFYHIRPTFDDTSMSAVLIDSIGLVEIAEALGSIEAISETVDVALMRQGAILFQSIAANPSTWSDLASRISSPTIFKEAVIHLVGQWQSMSAEQKSTLRAEVAEICEKKFAELQVKKKAVETRILSHYPRSLKRSQDARPSRTSYTGDIYVWITLNLFRHWFGQMMVEERGHNAKDGGANLYRQLWTAGYTYLDRNTMVHFHRHFPMTPRAVLRLESILSDIKDQMKVFVKELLVNNSQLDIKKEGTPYLTCCEVTKADLPWEQVTIEE